jgi:hypothetical protein
VASRPVAVESVRVSRFMLLLEKAAGKVVET